MRRAASRGCNNGLYYLLDTHRAERSKLRKNGQSTIVIEGGESTGANLSSYRPKYNNCWSSLTPGSLSSRQATGLRCQIRGCKIEEVELRTSQAPTQR